MNNNLIDLALSLKFNKAKIIDFNDIKFSKEFRKYCKENLCNSYKSNYSCPPSCGSFNAVYKKISTYKNALVIQSISSINTDNNADIKQAKKHHNQNTLLIQKYLKESGIKSVIAGAGNCDLCEKCNINNNMPCANKKDRFSSTSAYCIDVYNLCKLIGFDIVFTKDTISLISLVFF